MANPIAPTFLPPGVSPDGPYPVTLGKDVPTIENKLNRAILAGRGDYPIEALSADEDRILDALKKSPSFPLSRGARKLPLATPEKGFIKRAPLPGTADPEAGIRKNPFSFFL